MYASCSMMKYIAYQKVTNPAGVKYRNIRTEVDRDCVQQSAPSSSSWQRIASRCAAVSIGSERLDQLRRDPRIEAARIDAPAGDRTGADQGPALQPCAGQDPRRGEHQH